MVSKLQPKGIPLGSLQGSHAVLLSTPVVLCASLHLSMTSVVAGLALVILRMITGCPSAITIENLGGKKFFYL